MRILGPLLAVLIGASACSGEPDGTAEQMRRDVDRTVRALGPVLVDAAGTDFAVGTFGAVGEFSLCMGNSWRYQGGFSVAARDGERTRATLETAMENEGWKRSRRDSSHTFFDKGELSADLGLQPEGYLSVVVERPCVTLSDADQEFVHRAGHTEYSELLPRD